MKFKAFYGEEEHDVDVEPTEGGFGVTIDGKRHEVDTAILGERFYSLLVKDRSYEIAVREEERNQFTVRTGGSKQTVTMIDPLAASAGAHLGQTGPAELNAQMPGRVVKVLVQEGDEVCEGQGLIILEAMKMENEVAAPRDGTVTSLFVAEGDTLETGGKILVIT